MTERNQFRISGSWARSIPRILAFAGGHELGVMLAGLGVAIGIWTFAAIAGEVMESDTQAFNRKLLRRHAPPRRPRLSVRPRSRTVFVVVSVSGALLLSLALKDFTLGALLTRSQERKRLKAYFLPSRQP